MTIIALYKFTYLLAYLLTASLHYITELYICLKLVQIDLMVVEALLCCTEGTGLLGNCSLWACAQWANWPLGTLGLVVLGCCMGGPM